MEIWLDMTSSDDLTIEPPLVENVQRIWRGESKEVVEVKIEVSGARKRPFHWSDWLIGFYYGVQIGR